MTSNFRLGRLPGHGEYLEVRYWYIHSCQTAERFTGSHEFTG